jgi:hypothetical protein
MSAVEAVLVTLTDTGVMAAATRGDPPTKWRVHETQRQLRRILMGWDPIGVAGMPQAADEYDCMMGPLLRMLYEGARPSRIEQWLTQELKAHFGLSPDRSREARLAADLVVWWSRRAQEDDRPPGADPSRGAVGMSDLRGALVRLTVGEQPSEELPDLAAWALAGGEVDSPSLRELAGISVKDVRESRDLFLAAMAELDVETPRGDSYEEMARFWAGEMLAGAVSPYEASRHICWGAWEPLGRPSELAAFVGLASMWEDDPDHRARYEEDMLGEAGRLVAGG